MRGWLAQAASVTVALFASADSAIAERRRVADPVDEAWIESILQRVEKQGNKSSPVDLAAIARYPPSDQWQRVKAVFDARGERCMPELVAYFVRVHPGVARDIFRSHDWDMTAPPPPCTLEYFSTAAPLAMDWVFEEYMVVYLKHRDGSVAAAAARALGQYGHETAREGLWDAMRLFHETWKKREGNRGDVELQQALSHSPNWLLTPNELKTLRSLCVTADCVRGVEEDLRHWAEPIRVHVSEGPGGFRADVAQYNGIASIEVLEWKLGQFRCDTKVKLQASGVSAATLERIRRAAGRAGLEWVGSDDAR
ncbi:MAG: hypothetical protein U0Q16_02645 [Bryobacteraceae bacterium]